MANVVDWTVDKMLSSVKTIDAQAATVGARIKSDRARYMASLRALPEVADVSSREQLRAKLNEWIHRQVDVENRFNGFAAAWAGAKSRARDFLQGAHIQVPAYLNGPPLIVPAIIVAVIIGAAAVLAIVATQNNLQGKALDGLAGLVQNAGAQGWTAAQTTAAVDAYARSMAAAAAAGPSADPLGLGTALKAALPIVLGILAIVVVPPLLRSFKGSRPVLSNPRRRRRRRLAVA